MFPLTRPTRVLIMTGSDIVVQTLQQTEGESSEGQEGLTKCKYDFGIPLTFL